MATASVQTACDAKPSPRRRAINPDDDSYPRLHPYMEGAAQKDLSAQRRARLTPEPTPLPVCNCICAIVFKKTICSDESRRLWTKAKD